MSSTTAASTNEEEEKLSRGAFDFADGGRYRGEWRDGGAHGHGVCTLQGDGGSFQGLWNCGGQESGVFKWSSGQRYIGTWKNGTRHGLGKEVRQDGTEYVGDFQENARGPYGTLKLANGALYRGTWSHGLQDGIGVEIYADKGVYKGQYTGGQRNGFGTRSSSSYESYVKTLSHDVKSTDSIAVHDSLPSDATGKIRTSSLHRSTPRPGSALNLKHSSSSSEVNRPQHGITNLDFNTQIYEGQWEGDKRQGHGILKIPHRYTYFGEWKNNARTGHGVVVYENGQREEGLWEEGRLVSQLKRKKLSFKHHQLEAKVKQAHTAALQAADIARTKSILADSRASGALARSKAALKAVDKALSDAAKAVEISESLTQSNEKSSVVDQPSPSTDYEVLAKSHPAPCSSPSLLSVPSISPTPSYEDLRLLDKSNEFLPLTSSSDNLTDDDDSRSLLSDLDTQSLVSDPGSVLIRVKEASVDKSDKEMMKELLKKNQSDPPSRQGSVDSGLAKRKAKISKQMQMDDDSSLISLRRTSKQERVRRRQSYTPSGGRPKIDKKTGELTNSADNTEEDEISEEVLSQRKASHQNSNTSPLQQSVNMDVLTQMASWNKTIAYINFILLIFLLLLIVMVVAFMTTTLSQNNPASFMTHMA